MRNYKKMIQTIIAQSEPSVYGYLYFIGREVNESVEPEGMVKTYAYTLDRETSLIDGHTPPSIFQSINSISGAHDGRFTEKEYWNYDEIDEDRSGLTTQGYGVFSAIERALENKGCNNVIQDSIVGGSEIYIRFSYHPRLSENMYEYLIGYTVKRLEKGPYGESKDGPVISTIVSVDGTRLTLENGHVLDLSNRSNDLGNKRGMIKIDSAERIISVY